MVVHVTRVLLKLVLADRKAGGHSWPFVDLNTERYAQAQESHVYSLLQTSKPPRICFIKTMAIPKDILWDIKPHTRAKHKILREYLLAWIPILGMRHDPIVYIDGFAGPGKYKGGEAGSPIIALRAALMHKDRIGAMSFVFVEEREDRLEHLKAYVEGMMLPDKFHVHYFLGQFEEALNEILDYLEATGMAIAPTFAFIDPFGFKGVPMPLLHRLLEHRRTEVFTNFPVDPANRFKDHPEEETQRHIRRLLGGSLPEQEVDESGYAALRRKYQHELRKAAHFVRSFEMYNYEDRPIYDLFFGGNHPKGHLKMKEAMWKIDPEGDFRFSDATNPDQAVLFSKEPAPQLLELILDQFEDARKVPVGTIQEWVVAHTAFLITHMKEALGGGERQGRFFVLSKKLNGQKRHGKSFPADVVIDFSTHRPPEGEQGNLFRGLAE